MTPRVREAILISEAPIISLSCAGGSDEAWHMFTVESLAGADPVPHYVVSLDRGIEVHPDV